MAVSGAAGGVSPVRVPGVPGQVAVVGQPAQPGQPVPPGQPVQPGQPGVPPNHCGAITAQQMHATKQGRAGQMVAKAGIPPQHPEPVEYYGHYPNAKSVYPVLYNAVVSLSLCRFAISPLFHFKICSSTRDVPAWMCLLYC